MSRDDSLLYTGITSASRKVRENKKERLDNKRQKASELLPEAGLVFELLQEDKDMLGELLLGIVDPDSSDEKVQVKLEAIRLHRGWLLSYETRIKNALRLPKTKVPEDE